MTQNDFVEHVVTLCQQGRHADAVAFADRHRACWSSLSLDELHTVWSELVTSALAIRDGQLPGCGVP